MEGDLAAVEAYKSSGGDIARQLSSDEVRLLNRPSAFDDGFTLVHLAIRFQRQDMLAVLLTEVSRHLLQFNIKMCVSSAFYRIFLTETQKIDDLRRETFNLRIYGDQFGSITEVSDWP